MQYKFVQVKLNQLHYLREKIVDIHRLRKLRRVGKIILERKSNIQKLNFMEL